MRETILVIAPHPDDETLGCGGTLLRLKKEGHSINWLIVTSASHEVGYDETDIYLQAAQIQEATSTYGFDFCFQLKVPTTTMSQTHTRHLINEYSAIFNQLKPSRLFIPYCFDVHSDHYVASKAAIGCCKWFRNPFIKEVLFYETISETDFNINTAERRMVPNVYYDITDFFELKIKIMNIYKDQLGDFPFPRSEEAIEALAKVRGSQTGTRYAEAFELLRTLR